MRLLTDIGSINEARQIDDEENRSDEEVELCENSTLVLGIDVQLLHWNRIGLSWRLGACLVVARHRNLLGLKIVGSHSGKSLTDQ